MEYLYVVHDDPAIGHNTYTAYYSLQDALDEIAQATTPERIKTVRYTHTEDEAATSPDGQYSGSYTGYQISRTKIDDGIAPETIANTFNVYYDPKLEECFINFVPPFNWEWF